MQPRLFSAILLAAATLCHAQQPPAGRWDGTLNWGTLKVPFRIDFEGDADHIKASWVNADHQTSSSSGKFSDGKLLLTFNEANLDATLADGQLKGQVKTPAYGTLPFTASPYCSCGYEGEAGPDISGIWETPIGQIEIKRKGEDTFLTTGDLGPLSGRFDGAVFTLHYFNGTRPALLEIEQNKTGGLDLLWMEPGGRASKKLKAKPKL